jgi:translation initiation factor IF-2
MEKKKTKNENLIKGIPVVVVLGHIDSGKTSLLDQIRKSKVAEKESGGITQHIGAYQIEIDGQKITFVDTPGHEAFSQMRSRGAKVADIALLIVDSRKGVQTQTKEVISSIKKIDLPVIVVLNKIDRPDAFTDKAKRELQKEGIEIESLGGNVPVAEVSAKTGQGVEDLLDLILLVAEMQNIHSEVSKPAKGVIIESYLDNKRGPTATIITAEGIFKNGDFVATLSCFGKIKFLEDFQGQKVEKAYPSDPIVLLGLNTVPKIGEKIKAFNSLQEAKEHVSQKDQSQIELPKKDKELEEGQKVLNLILKTDFLGSIEALGEVLRQLPQEKIILNVVKAEVGQINETDVKLAKSTKALILGFRVKTNPSIIDLAQRKDVRIINFKIIYELIEEVRKYMEKMLKPETVRTDLGKLKVLVGFWSDKNRQIVGGRIIEGEIIKGASIEVLRDDEVIDKGRMINLQRNKKDIQRASRGEEVGILYEGQKKIEKGDVLTIFKKEKQKIEL